MLIMRRMPMQFLKHIKLGTLHFLTILLFIHHLTIEKRLGLLVVPYHERLKCFSQSELIVLTYARKYIQSKVDFG